MTAPFSGVHLPLDFVELSSPAILFRYVSVPSGPRHLASQATGWTAFPDWNGLGPGFVIPFDADANGGRSPAL
jgi:hypothetical protein